MKTDNSKLVFIVIEMVHELRVINKVTTNNKKMKKMKKMITIIIIIKQSSARNCKYHNGGDN